MCSDLLRNPGLTRPLEGLKVDGKIILKNTDGNRI
jgi:hypothetical protein